MVYYQKAEAWVRHPPPDDETLDTLDLTTSKPASALAREKTFAKGRPYGKYEFQAFAQDVARKVMGKVCSSLVPFASSLAPLMFALSSCRLVKNTSHSQRSMASA